MERKNYFCDRCGSQTNRETISEIDIRMFSERNGEEKYESLDMCDDCYNSLIKWFGEINPFTGTNFYKKK